MRSLRTHRRGISEIVGALMLVLIVVGAATALAAFVASYQKQLQAERSITQQRSLEHLTILRGTPTLTSAAVNWSTVNFTLASLYIYSSTVTGLSVDHNPVRQYTAWSLDLTNGTFASVTVGPGGQLVLPPRAQVSILLNFTVGTPGYSFYNGSGFSLRTTNYVEIDVFTVLQNEFSRVFIPPTALALVSTLQTWNGSAFVTKPVLDGSQSFQPGNASLVAWSWTVTPDGLSYTGERAVASFNSVFHTHNITLTVLNSDGFLGVNAIHYP